MNKLLASLVVVLFVTTFAPVLSFSRDRDNNRPNLYYYNRRNLANDNFRYNGDYGNGNKPYLSPYYYDDMNDYMIDNNIGRYRNSNSGDYYYYDR